MNTLSKCCLAMVLFSPACATYHVTLGGFSKHFEPTYHGKAYNEIHNNVGAGLQYRKDDTAIGLTVQYVTNSFDRPSMFTTGHIMGTNVRWGKFTNATGVALGFATGYEDRYGAKSSNPIPVLGILNDACFFDFCLYQLVLPPYDGMAGVAIVGGKYNLPF